MKNLKLIVAGIIFTVFFAFSAQAQQTTDEARAEGIASSALVGCISSARAGNNDILVTVFPREGEGNYAVRFCGSRRDVNYVSAVGYVILENWQVVETLCEWPAPTANPCD
jgi:hypothetical protein